MTTSHRFPVLTALAILSIAMLLTSCASNRTQAFQLSFLPSTPLPFQPALDQPPQLESYLFARESPNLIERTIAQPPRPMEVDARIARAEDHFEAGKRLYQNEDMAGARTEFDLAIGLLISAPENLPDRPRLERKLDQLVDTIYRYDLEGLGAAGGQPEVVYDRSPLAGILDMTFPTDPNLRPKVREELNATVSQLPLEENDAVLGYIHYFSSPRGRKILIAGLRRAGRYRPLIQRILDEEGVPQELIYLAQIESGFLPRARSNKKAVGMWQFVQFRGREYGLNQSPTTDDRMDPEQATRAAARHLRDLYASFGDWYLAMAAYNCGPGCVDRAVQRTGFADFWELRNHKVLPKDTDNYVPVILAITIMAKNPKDYDLANLDMDEPVEYDSLTVDVPTSLGLIADAADRPLPEIQDLNPAVLKQVAPAGYSVRVPKGTSTSVQAALETIPTIHRANWRVHRVAPGETLAIIGRRYAMSAASIAAANRNAGDPETGDLLVIPSGYPAPHRSVATSKSQAGKGAASTSVSARPKTARRAVASKEPRPAAPRRKAAAATYRTASLTAKHRPAAN
jgi:membrane-bound lytic murein transglycosylase D